MSYSRLFANLLLCCHFCLLGCGETTTLGPPPNLSKLEDDVILAGFGTKDVHIGMDIDQLGPDWAWASDLYPDGRFQNHNLYNRKIGVMIAEDDGRVEAARYFYDPKAVDAERPFAGRTERGIKSNSTIEDIIKTYGQPESIAATIGDGNFGRPFDPARDDVDLDYIFKGISFLFKGEKLESIAVSPPATKYDPELHRDIGPVARYRAVEVPEQKD